MTSETHQRSMSNRDGRPMLGIVWLSVCLFILPAGLIYRGEWGYLPPSLGLSHLWKRERRIERTEGSFFVLSTDRPAPTDGRSSHKANAGILLSLPQPPVELTEEKDWGWRSLTLLMAVRLPASMEVQQSSSFLSFVRSLWILKRIWHERREVLATSTVWWEETRLHCCSQNS